MVGKHIFIHYTRESSTSCVLYTYKNIAAVQWSNANSRPQIRQWPTIKQLSWCVRIGVCWVTHFVKKLINLTANMYSYRSTNSKCRTLRSVKHNIIWAVSVSSTNRRSRLNWRIRVGVSFPFKLLIQSRTPEKWLDRILYMISNGCSLFAQLLLDG